MKKLFIVAVLVFGFSSVTFAQTNERAIGLRFGNGVEFSYLHPLTDNQRVQFDVGSRGFLYPSFMGIGTYQWLFPIENGFDWYIGGGAQLGIVSYENSNHAYAYGLNLGIAGIGGVQYNFDFPLQLAADFRPSWLFFNPGVSRYFGGLYDFGISARYRF
ncbi:MAG: hypothetical protein ACK5KP_09180 [Paludibacteraceae bacterium]